MIGYIIGIVLGIMVFLFQNLKPSSIGFRVMFLIGSIIFIWSVFYAHLNYWNIAIIPIGEMLLCFVSAFCFPYNAKSAAPEYDVIHGSMKYILGVIWAILKEVAVASSLSGFFWMIKWIASLLSLCNAPTFNNFFYGGITLFIVLFVWRIIYTIKYTVKAYGNQEDVIAASNLNIDIDRFFQYEKIYNKHQSVMQKYGVHSKQAEDSFIELFSNIKNQNEWRRYSDWREQKQREKK